MVDTSDPASALRPLFQLDPEIHFLNHGSFGATPRAVQRAASRWRARMERQPVAFLGRNLYVFLAQARAALADYLGAQADDVAFVANATVGVNVVARSLAAILQPGDEILATDHEYGACSNAWESVCAQTGARYVRQPMPMPDELPASQDSRATLAEIFLAGITPRTRVIFLSHMTSPTAVRFPIEEIVEHARARGILTLVDGAHAPGQIPLDLTALGADFYTGNCHKWLCAPKGSGFLYVRREVQSMIRPLVVSWGWAPERQYYGGGDFQDSLMWGGTADFSPYLAIPDAIRFQQRHDWDTVRVRCARLLDEWLPRFAAAASLEPVYSRQTAALRPIQMAVTPLPDGIDAPQLKQRLHDEFHIEIPFTRLHGRNFLRLSVQGYTTRDDLAALEHALCILLTRQ